MGNDPFEKIRAGGPYRVIYADPPWPEAKQRELVAPKYPTMTAEDILALPVRELIHPEGTLLVLWSTWRHLDLAMKTIPAWGFKHVTGAPWLKMTQNGEPHTMWGSWFAHCTEPILIAKAGASVTPPRPARKGIFMSFKEGHSKKPAEVRDWIRESFDGPRLEMFARLEYDGWTAWGNEIAASMPGDCAATEGLLDRVATDAGQTLVRLVNGLQAAKDGPSRTSAVTALSVYIRDCRLADIEELLRFIVDTST